MKFFKFEEFRCRCCGGLPPLAKENIEALVENVLDPARQRYGGPVLVNSGYRCQKHNAEVGGVPNSQHISGEAADICCGDNERLAKMYVDEFTKNIATPLEKRVDELTNEVKELKDELENVKRNACYCAGCPNRISVLG